MILTRLNALQYTKVLVVLTPFVALCAQSYFLSQVLPLWFKHLKSILKSQHYSAAGAAQPSSFPRCIPLQHLWAFFGTVSVEFPVKAQMPAVSTTAGICRVYAVYFAAKISRIRFAASEGVLPTFTPAASRASFFA